MFSIMTLTQDTSRAYPQVLLPAALRVDFDMRDQGGGCRAVARNARWRAQVEIGDLEPPVSRSRLATAGRPWLQRDARQCAYVVAGEGPWSLACCAPGVARRGGYACYCPAHAAEIYAPREEGLECRG
jgi:hypothetical protein